MKVHVGSLYRFAPSFMDLGIVERGTIVRVINLHGCPKANVMGQCYVEHLGGEFIQMVCTGSLQKLTEDEKRTVRKATTPAKHRIPSTHFKIEYADEAARSNLETL